MNLTYLTWSAVGDVFSGGGGNGAVPPPLIMFGVSYKGNNRKDS